MKLIETERIYCIKITNRQMGTIMRKDNAARERLSPTGFAVTDNLLGLVCSVKGVREVHCDPMFGPFIHVRVESEDAKAMTETLVNVKRAIAKYVR